MKEIVLSEDRELKKLAKKENNRSEITRRLITIVDELIEEAKTDWLTAQREAREETTQRESDQDKFDEEVDVNGDAEIPKPLIRLRVEYSAPDGGNFDCENPQRFSNRFVGKVANVGDVVQFHRNKVGQSRKMQNGVELPEQSILAQLSIDSVKVEKLVREFLTAQSLTILPQNSFGDAVSQFVDKDDKHAMEMFVNESLTSQIKHLMNVDRYDDDEIHNAMDQYKSKLEELFNAGHLRKAKHARLKPRPDNWDTDLDGEWADQPGAHVYSDVGEEDDDDEGGGGGGGGGSRAAKKGPPAKGRAPRAKAAPKASSTAAATKAAAAASKPTRGGKKKVVQEEEEDEDEDEEDVMLIDSDGVAEDIDDDNDDDDDDGEEQSQLFVKPVAPVGRGRGGRKPVAAARGAGPTAKTTAASKWTSGRAAAAAGAAGTQSKISFSQQQPAASQAIGTGRGRGKAAAVPVRDEISDDDDDDAFAPAPPMTTRRSRR